MDNAIEARTNGNWTAYWSAVTHTVIDQYDELGGGNALSTQQVVDYINDEWGRNYRQEYGTLPEFWDDYVKDIIKVLNDYNDELKMAMGI